jgi:malonate-semialdehyde dehydrogenase (acetylating)/methylmalonate-semialdehyde dehydrogenase
MVGPFNFPAMVPFWFIPYALAAGNTYVAKPSEQVPRTMFELTQLMERAELPPGVFNLLNGDKEVSQGLMEDPEVQGISFVGSSRVCRIVSTTCSANNKRYQAMGGAKNHLVVMPDANRDKAIANMVTSCFGCAGQRCMAASAIVCVGEETYSDIVERFVSAARNIAVADPLDPAVADRAMVMGPLISARARESILSLIQDGISEGARPALDGSGFTLTSRPGGHFVGPTVLADVRPGMKVHRTEIFGPVVVMLRVNTLDEAIAVINEHEYGNGASIYTQSGYHARKFKIEALAGMIGVNVGIPAPVAYLPFGGMKESMHSDIKAQGAEVVEFFTERKIVTERYWE